MTYRAEWGHVASPEWEARLRQISPVVDRTSHLRFRWNLEHETWLLYECVPAEILAPDRREQLSQHWSELPTDQQHGRQRFVSEYQFWMWSTARVDARPFWVLQGSKTITGGTPYCFTDREQRLLDAEQIEAEPIPVGTLPPIPFDERVVEAVVARDKLFKMGGDLDRLEKANRPEALKAADEILEQDFRRKFLKWHHEEMAPCAAFYGWFAKRKESEQAFRPAPENLADVLADWKDQYIETGIVDGAGHPVMRKVQIAVR